MRQIFCEMLVCKMRYDDQSIPLEINAMGLGEICVGVELLVKKKPVANFVERVAYCGGASWRLRVG